MKRPAVGLWVRTAVSFVLVTVGAVVLVEAVLIGLSARVIGDQVTEQDRLRDVRELVNGEALKLSSQVSQTGSADFPTATAPATASPGAGPGPTATPVPTATAQFLPSRAGSCKVAAQGSGISLLINPDGTVLESSYPDCYPSGTAAPAPILAAARTGSADDVGTGVVGDRVAWALAPVVQAPPATFDADPPGKVNQLLDRPGTRRVASLYIEQPLTGQPAGYRLGNVRPLVIPGLVVLVAAVPVGLLFGYVTMRRPVRRLRRLAVTAQALAEGHLDRRIEVAGRDELSQLEADMNRMAQRLAEALVAQRELAAARARGAERARIAAELHDAVSQELFSLRLLATGVARALPAGSPLREQVVQLEGSASRATREMHAMLLELRPAALDDGGLAGALGRLAESYRARIGVDVRTDLTEVTLDAEREHALLRIAQEALANAVRHGEPGQVTLTLTPRLLRVRDDGRGFDPTVPAHGMGLALMRERAASIGAALLVTSEPGAGTTVEVRLP